MNPNAGRQPFAIDDAFPADQSVVLRYAQAVCAEGLTRQALLETSQREGMRLLELGTWKGANLYLVDESTGMSTGTYKSLDGCVTTAVCRAQGIERIAFSSGANVGIALTHYGARVGLETYFFCPTSTLYKLDGALFDRPTAHLIGVEGSDRRVKAAARLFAHWTRTPILPNAAWRLRSAACRGLFLGEQFRSSPRRFDWFAQAICAGYGPLGIYEALGGLVASQAIARAMVPRFLGIQQADLAPIAEAWASGQEKLPPTAGRQSDRPLIEPSLYNVHPAATYPELRGLLQEYGGAVHTVSSDDFARLEGEFTGMLRAAGVHPTRIGPGSTSPYVERAGLMAGVGTLLAIQNGTVQPGQSVLCSFTGGAGPAPSRPATPEFHINASQPLRPQLRKYLERVTAPAYPAKA